MNPNKTEKDDCNIRNSTAIPSHGYIPKWLKDITDIEENHKEHSFQSQMSDNSLKNDPNSLDSMNQLVNKLEDLDVSMYNERKYSRGDIGEAFLSNNIPTKIPHIEKPDESNSLNTHSGKDSTKYGRRASLVNQIFARNTPKNISLSSTNYLVPKLDSFDFKTSVGNTDFYQQNLEKSWKSLNEFNHSHKGRLDSAKHFTGLEQNLGDCNKSIISEHDVSYSPSFLEPTVPSRSRSEISNYLPLYVYQNIKKATETACPNKLIKSKSSESVCKMQPSAENLTASYNSECNLATNKEKSTQKFDSSFELRLNEYRMKIMKENQLRDEIINDLLSENERITNHLRRRSSDSESYLKMPNLQGDASNHKKMYNKNSKYKMRRDIFESGGHDLDNVYTEEMDNIVFIIPELPKGQSLIIDILSTWGDKYYVGLNGIEIFDSSGKLANIKKISAVPPDVNILPECSNDPRVVRNLLDGVNRTQDDMHIWLAPFDPGCSHIITIDFKEITTIAMIRVWNYNKSRIHSYRGVKDVVMLLDGYPIFKGEIVKASGGILGGIESFGDTILFTTNDEILEKISKNDTSYNCLTSRPLTPNTIERPLTSALQDNVRPITGKILSTTTYLEETSSEQILLGANRIHIILVSNWGHLNLIGLTGLEIIQGDNILNSKKITLACNVKGKSYFLSRLVNGVNITTDSKNMWSTFYNFGEEVIITLDLQEFEYISGIRIWNYNENLEKTYGGVRNIRITLDNKPILNPLTGDEFFVLRRAPGNEHYDYCQDINFSDTRNSDVIELPIAEKDNSLQNLPEGFVYQFIIYSTWGDTYYCGLNGIEFYNEHGKLVKLDEQNICAYPESVNSLPNIDGDVRTPEKLIDEVKDDLEGLHSWLAPIIPKHLNRIYIVLDQPITISYIKIWNYSKTPDRGIKDFGILVDDLLVYNGTLRKNFGQSVNSYQTVLFTEDEDLLGEESEILIRNSNYVHDVLLYDGNKETKGKHAHEGDPDPALRPYTSVSPFVSRGYTSHSH